MGTNENNESDFVPPSTRPDRLPIWYWVVVACILSALVYCVTIGVHEYNNSGSMQPDDSSLVTIGGHSQAPPEKKPSLSDLPTWAQSIAIGTPAG